MPASIVLSGSAREQYVADLVQVLRSSRLNNNYPRADAVGRMIRCLAVRPETGHQIEVDVRSGLPVYREWTQIWTDYQVAEGALAELGDPAVLERKAREAAPDSIFCRQWSKYQYLRSLQEQVLPAPDQMDVSLRRVDSEAKRAHFHVVLDKLDVSGLYVRYSIDLAQVDSVWGRPMVKLDRDTASHTQGFRSLIYKFSSLDAEFTFGKLVALGNLEVERVSKGTLGPVYWQGMHAPEPIRAVLEQGADFVATFALDQADVHLNQDRDNDPLDDLFCDSLSEEARETYIQGRERYGYHVFKDRKFVVPAGYARAIQELGRPFGARNICYQTRPRRTNA